MYTKQLSLHHSQHDIPKACTEKVLLMKDRISDLPDDILLHIISPLTLKEVGSTSVLSKRWRHVWAYVPSLNFDASQFLHLRTLQEIREEEPKYFRWVDQVVSSHRAHTIDDFMVRFRSLHHRNDDIDKWLKFAMEKKVKRLQLDMLMNHREHYTFPSLSLSNTLTSLELGGADVTGEIVQKFLSCCQNLELLSLSNSDTPVDLRVVDPPKLKYLKIAHTNVEYLEISAPNLIYFYYYGFRLLSPPLKSIPKLVELHIEYISHIVIDFSTHYSSFIPQLEALTLYVGAFDCPVSPVGPKLKMLRVVISPDVCDFLFDIGSLVHAYPFLYRLEVKISILHDLSLYEEWREPEVFPHPHLKILEIGGFIGCEADVAFAIYLIKTFVSVEKITIGVPDYMSPHKNTTAEAKEEAERLRTLVKPGTELEIIVCDYYMLKNSRLRA